MTRKKGNRKEGIKRWENVYDDVAHLDVVRSKHVRHNNRQTTTVMTTVTTTTQHQQ